MQIPYLFPEFERIVNKINLIKIKLNNIDGAIKDCIEEELKLISNDVEVIKKVSNAIQQLEKEINDREDEIEYYLILLKEKDEEIKRLNEKA